MIAILKLTRWIYRTLAGGTSPSQLAYGLCLGFFIALLPFSAPLTWVLLSLLLFTRASVWLLMLSATLLKPLYALGLHKGCWHVGRWLLEDATFARPLLERVLRAPVVALLGFDRYVVMGGFVVALALTIVLFIPIRRFVIWFRAQIQPHAEQSRFVRTIMGFWFVKALRFVFVGTSMT